MTFDAVANLVLGGLVGAFIQWVVEKIRNTTERFELWCDVLVEGGHTADMARIAATGATLQVDGKPAESPLVAHLYIWASGRRDIARSQFDGGRNLQVKFNGKVLKFEPDMIAENQSADVRIKPTITGVVLKPSLVRKRFAVHYRFVLDKFQTFSIESPLENVEVRSFYDEWRRPVARRVWQRVAGIVLILIPVLFTVLVIPFGQQIEDWRIASKIDPTAMGVLLASLVISGAFLLTYAGLASRAAQRAVGALRRSLGSRVIPWERVPEGDETRLIGLQLIAGK